MFDRMFKNLNRNKIQFSINFQNPRFVLENLQIFLFLFYNVYKEKMFTIDKVYGREAP